MVNLNRIFLVGNLTRDPELRYTPQGTAVATLRIAVNSSFKDKSGQFQKETCFINVIVWAQAAESCNQNLGKGRQVFVEGRLMSRTWKDKEEKSHTVIEVQASKVQFMPKAAAQEGKSADLGEEPQGVTTLEATDPGEIL